MTLACFLGGLEESRGPQGKKFQEEGKASYGRCVQSMEYEEMFIVINQWVVITVSV